MEQDLIDLYRTLGYMGPLPDTHARVAALTDAANQQIDELPPLDLKGVNVLDKMYEKDPGETLKTMNSFSELPMNPEYFGALVEQARDALTHPAECLRQMESRNQFSRIAARAPDSWPSKYPSFDDIDVKPERVKYEPRADLLGWIINSGSYYIAEKLGFCNKNIFRTHGKNGLSDFVYTMKDRQDNPFESGRLARFGFFADFGTGEYHSLFIAKHLEQQFDLDYVIHLGDVYYAGRDSEFKNFMWNPLKDLMSKTRMFWMAGNHEKYSCYKPYYKYMDHKKNEGPAGFQEQEGSYFCIRSDRFQVIGIDTAFWKNGRYQKSVLARWLKERFREGSEHSPPLINILLSPNDPYNLGSKTRRGLLNDLDDIVDLDEIDLWFWGNTHHAAFYRKTKATPFWGSCIGHAGHPIVRRSILNNSMKEGLAPAAWVDTSYKFPQEEFPGVRPDLNNHGFCIMELHKEKIILEYYDWLMRKQNVVDIPTDILA